MKLRDAMIQWMDRYIRDSIKIKNGLNFNVTTEEDTDHGISQIEKKVGTVDINSPPWFNNKWEINLVKRLQI